MGGRGTNSRRMNVRRLLLCVVKLSRLIFTSARAEMRVGGLRYKTLVIFFRL